MRSWIVASARRVLGPSRCATRRGGFRQLRLGHPARSAEFNPCINISAPRPLVLSRTFASRPRPAALNSAATAISTVSPSKLTPQDYITSVPWNDVRTRLKVERHRDGRPLITLVHPPSHQEPIHLRNILRGFLYYHQPPRAPPLSGHLRLRLTTSSDPASFSSGTDFTTRRGVPWSVPLTSLAGHPRFAPVLHLLTAVDGTVSREVADLARRFYRNFHSGDIAGTRYMHSFGQPFDLALDRATGSFALVGRDRIEHTRIRELTSFTTRPSLRREHFPFSGTAICCFEPSSLADHAGKRVVVIRVLRSLEWDPIRPNPSYDGPLIPLELVPLEGQLLMTMRFRKVRRWARDVDERVSKKGNNARPLGALFENALEYGSL